MYVKESQELFEELIRTYVVVIRRNFGHIQKRIRPKSCY